MNEKKAADFTVDFVTGKITFDEAVKIIKKIFVSKNLRVSKNIEALFCIVSYFY